MANDDPTSLRMGFGYHQARAAGLGGVREARSPRQVNQHINSAQMARKLRAEVMNDGEWGPLVKHLIEQGVGPVDAFDVLGRAKMYMWLKRKGFPLKYRLRWRP